MKLLAILLLLAPISAVNASAQDELKIDNPSQLAGKKLHVLRAILCEPGTFTKNLDYAGKQATVASVKPGNTPQFLASTLNRMPPQSRAILEDQMKAATLLLQFDDGKKLDTCAPIGPRRIAEYFELAPGETLAPVAAGPASTAASSPTAAVAITPNPECPVVMTKVSSSDGGFGHAFADAMTSSEFERDVDRASHGGKGKHYLDMRARNNGQKEIRAVESV